MSVLVTGGTGFIGCRLALRLLDLGHNVIVLGLARNPFEKANVKRLESAGAIVKLASVLEVAAIADAVKGVEIVYHLAAAQHEANVGDQWFWDVNVIGSENVLKASVAEGVGRLVHASTIGVYGPSANGPINETSPANPGDIYGKTKLEGEKLALSYQDQLSVVVVRVSETYGPGDRRLIKLFRAIKKGIVLVVGDGTNLHHPIYIDDLIEALDMAARSETPTNGAVVVAGKEPLSTNEMVQAIAAQLGSTAPIRHAPLFLFKSLALLFETTLAPLGIQPPIHRRRLDFFVKSFAFSMDEAKQVLGFSPETSFHDGIARTARWYAKMGYIS